MYNSKVMEALDLSIRAHLGQKRKYTEHPYVIHPMRVALRAYAITNNPDVVIAALLHDVVEDSEYTHEDIEDQFGTRVADLVEELTDYYTKEDFPDLNRRERKKREFHKMRGISSEARVIKILDKIDNLNEFDIEDSFFKVYLGEGRQLHEALFIQNCPLSIELEQLLREFEIKLEKLKENENEC